MLCSQLFDGMSKSELLLFGLCHRLIRMVEGPVKPDNGIGRMVLWKDAEDTYKDRVRLQSDLV